MNKRAAVVGLGTAALAALAAAKVRGALQGVPQVETGTFTNGMEYARWGDGSKTLVWIPTFADQAVPRGPMAGMTGARFRPFVEAGYSVWFVTRKRNMPAGHSVEDMAADYASLISDQFGGRVDTVLGVSYGGLIVLYLAANHPESAEHFVAAGAAGTYNTWSHDVDYRLAQAMARGDKAEAGRVMAEYFYPQPSQARARAVLGAALAALSSGEQVSAGDLMVEAEAEVAYDSRDALPRISVPVLLVCGEEDLCLTKEIVDETVALIPDCTLIRYPGKGHLRSIMGGQLVEDVLEYIQQ